MTYSRDRDPTERMFERLSKNQDVETGLHRLENSPDPAVRDMARAVLNECDEGRKRIEERKVGNIIGGVIVVIFIFVMIIVLISRGNKGRSY